MPTERRTVDVVANWVGLREPVLMGRLHATPSRGKEIFSFEYDRAWLRSDRALVIDPSLRLDRGPQYAPTGRESFGVFLDSSPDRWGRVLLQRREAQQARIEDRRERPLLESDYLLGVYDGHRLGGLRFRIGGGPFLDDKIELASPGQGDRRRGRTRRPTVAIRGQASGHLAGRAGPNGERLSARRPGLMILPFWSAALRSSIHPG